MARAVKLRVAAALGGALGLGLVVVLAVATREARLPVRCARGLVMIEHRCCGEGQHLERGRCTGAPLACAEGQRATNAGCVPESRRIDVAGGSVERLPFDWDAPAAAATGAVVAAPLRMDSHEVTEGEWAACVAAGACGEAPSAGEPGLPQTRVNAHEAAQFCRHRGGRLPTSAELAFAAMGQAGRRYPWANAGLVCRRAAFALVEGPCAHGGVGPDLAGSHPEGRSPEGVHDLAGNVAEWTEPAGGVAKVRGGSFRDRAATALRTFSYRSVPADARDDTIGFRCVYAAER